MGSMSRRVRRRLNNPLDQWTPATVAAAQANRPRTYGMPPHINPGRVYGMELSESTGGGTFAQGGYDMQVWARGVLSRGKRVITLTIRETKYGKIGATTRQQERIGHARSTSLTLGASCRRSDRRWHGSYGGPSGAASLGP